MRDGIYWFSGGKQDWSCLAIQMQNEYFLAIKRNNIAPSSDFEPSDADYSYDSL